MPSRRLPQPRLTDRKYESNVPRLELSLTAPAALASAPENPNADDQKDVEDLGGTGQINSPAFPIYVKTAVKLTRGGYDCKETRKLKASPTGGPMITMVVNL